MKAVFLIAGKGRRLEKITENNHKSLIELDNYSLLHHLIENFIYAGITDFIPIVGHCSNKILSCFNKKYSSEIKVTSIYNHKYTETNNLYSLYCAKEILEGEEFILCNADVVLDKEIILTLKNKTNLSAIVIDDFNYLEPIDSPGILLEENKITDLGRHIPFKKNKGYAIGVYKFNKELSKNFFKEARQLLNQNINAGFHDPLPKLFSLYSVYKHSTDKKLWTDIDTFEDIEKARNIHKQILKKYNKDE